MSTKTKQDSTPAPQAPAPSKYQEIATNLERADQIEARLIALEKEQRTRLSGPLPQADAGERLALTLRAMRENIERAPQGSGGLTAHGIINSLSGGGPPLALRADAPVDVLNLLLFVLGPDLEERARQAVGRLTYAPGLGMADREALRRSLFNERAALVQEHETLTDALIEAGVSREHLVETVRRRNQEAAVFEAESHLRDRQRQAEEVLAEEHPDGEDLAVVETPGGGRQTFHMTDGRTKVQTKGVIR